MNLFSLRNALSLPLLLGLAAPAYALPLTPQYAGLYQNGDGANSRWVQVADDWRGSLQGSETWGTGIWGLSDHTQVMGLASNDPSVVQTLATHVDQINFADQRFINEWGSSWSTPQLAPIFDNHAEETQDNWASSFWGHIAITTAGAYNFGVLYDDGFRFSLFGSGGSSQGIQIDGLNPRDRLGFAEDLQLTPGLYGFQLDAYERLEAGAVQLAWFTPGSNDWALVPQANLFASPIPEPSVPMLMLAGLAALGLINRRTRG
jgi:hypothetical protein